MDDSDECEMSGVREGVTDRFENAKEALESVLIVRLDGEMDGGPNVFPAFSSCLGSGATSSVRPRNDFAFEMYRGVPRVREEARDGLSIMPAGCCSRKGVFSTSSWTLDMSRSTPSTQP